MKSKPLLLFLVLVIAVLFLFCMNNKIFKVQEGFSTNSLTPTIFAGGTSSTSFVAGQGTAVRFGGTVYDIQISSSGNIYGVVANSIVKITPDATVSMYERGLNPSALCIDSSENIYYSNGAAVYKIDSSGSRSTYATTGLEVVGYIACDSSRNIYFTSGKYIRKIPANGGAVTTLAGSSISGNFDGIGTTAKFKSPKQIVADSTGNVYVFDDQNFNIRKITPTGTVTTLAGSGTKGSGLYGSDGTGTSATFGNVRGMSIDSRGNIYLGSGNYIRKITPSGTVTTISADPLMNSPSVVVNSTGRIYVSSTSGIYTLSQQCPIGQYSTGEVCVPCPLGSYSATGTVCTACPVGTSTPSTGSSNSNQCTEVGPGHYMSNTTIIQCPSFTICPGGSRTTTRGYTCMNGYNRSGFDRSCLPCRIGSYGSNELCMPCTDIAPTSTVATWTTLATAQTSCIPETCKPNHKLNRLSNICEPCPLNTGGSNCTGSLPGYYISNGVIIPCPSNASCTGGSATFVCSNGYMLNQMGDGCLQCGEGLGGSDCTEAAPGHYLRDNRSVPCPSNAICKGGILPYTCSNGYFVNNINGTCDLVTTIVQPGNSQLRNTIGTPQISDTTGCTPTGCILLFRDPVTGTMLPTNPCMREGNNYNFATKKCFSKCCLMPMPNAKNDPICKVNVLSTAVRKPGMCPLNSPNACCKSDFGKEKTCKKFWNTGVNVWSPEHNRICADRFTDYNKLETMLEKRQKWYESRKILNSS